MYSLPITTSLFNSLLLLVGLKLLQVFHFVNWHPIKFMKNWAIFSDSPPLIRWMLLFVFLFIASLIVYFLLQYSYLIPPAFTSIVVGLAIAFVMEWIIYDLPAEAASFKELSIPFIVVVILSCRFIIETSIFAYKEKIVS